MILKKLSWHGREVELSGRRNNVEKPGSDRDHGRYSVGGTRKSSM